MQISYRTVESYFEKIKLKFGCFNKSKLIEKAISYGYLNKIPQSLFNKQLSVKLEYT